MSIEMSIVGKESLPNNRWTEKLKKQIDILPKGKYMQFILPKKQPIGGLLSAWYKLCKSVSKKAKSIQRTHELGTTVWLWYE